MALTLADRVRDTTTTTGQGTVTLSGTAPTGYQTFGTAVGNANTTYYTIAGGAEWEVGLGTYTASGTTLSRDTVLSSSAGGTTKTTFSAGTKDVFVTYPAEVALYTGGPLGTPASGTVTNLTGTASINVNGTVGATTATTGAFTSITASTTATITSTNANALAVGRLGATTPVLKIDASTASQVGGLSVTGSSAGNGVTLAAIGSLASEPITVVSKGSGTATFGSSGTVGNTLLQTNSTTRVTLSGGGAVTFVRSAATLGSTVGFTVTTPADTNLTLSTEVNAVLYNFTASRQWATGALPLQREFLITAPTYRFVGASTLTDAATFGVTGAPVGGTNATLTNSHGIYVPTSVLANTTNGFGATFVAPTGASNNYSFQWSGKTLGNGDLLFTDATYDIGKSGATRPRDGFFSRNITIGGTLTVTGAASIQGLTVGLGASAVATNTALGVSALAANTTGANNSASGYQALASNTTGDYNSALGSLALANNTTGVYNSAFGASALATSTSGSNNTAVGLSALAFNTTGGTNTAVGATAMYANTTASQNAAFGYGALAANTTGPAGTAVGWSALGANTTGTYNTAVGAAAMLSNTTGGFNTALGLEGLKANTTGSGNTGIGSQTFPVNTTGIYNTGIGANAMGANTTGSGNVMVGGVTSAGAYSPVFNPTTENDRVMIGSTATTNAYVQVAWTAVSDMRDKTDFGPVPLGLDFVTQLKPTAYRYKADREDTEGNGPLRYGFLAQDILALEGASPVIIDNEDPDKLKITDQNLIAVLVNALQEASAKIDALTTRIAILEAR